MDYGESPVTRGYKKFFEIYKADIDRIPMFDQFVLALKEALTVCQVTSAKGAPRAAAPAGDAGQFKAARLRLGLSLKALSRAAHISVLTLRGLERGTVRPQAGTLKKLTEALRTAERSR